MSFCAAYATPDAIGFHTIADGSELFPSWLFCAVAANTATATNMLITDNKIGMNAKYDFLMLLSEPLAWSA